MKSEKYKICFANFDVGAAITPRACIICSSLHFAQLIDSRPHLRRIAKKNRNKLQLKIVAKNYVKEYNNE
jgi:hypothetical protein